MDMSKIAALGTATPLVPVTDAAGQLQGSMNGLEICFRDVGETLAAAIDTIDRMASGLDDIRRSLSPDTAGAAVERLRQVAHRLSTLPTQQRRRAIEIETLTGRTKELRNLLGEIGTILDLLGIYGVNIKIASSGEPAFFDFVTGMDRKLESGRREVKHIARELDQSRRVVEDVRKADRSLADESARTGSHVPAELTANADALQNHIQAVTRTTDEVAGIVRTVQGEVARILGAIQIGDSVRQRAEHCITILRRIDTEGASLPPAARAHLQRLVEAQLRAMSEDFRREVDAIVVSLDRLSPLADDLRRLLASQGGGDGQLLVRIESGIAELDSVTRQLCHADGNLASLTAFVTQTLGELAQGLARIQNIAVDVQNISTNTRLLSRRHGENGRAVAVIAKEVAPCATRLDQLGVAISAQIKSLTTIDLVQDGGAAANETTLSEPLAIIRAACASSDAAMSRGGDEAERIIASLQSSAGDLAEQLSMVETLIAVADALSLHASAAAPEGEALPEADHETLLAILPWVASLYTMACEREIHAHFLLPGMTPPVVAAPVTFDDDDDGLF
jgi:hypothetical protein